MHHILTQYTLNAGIQWYKQQGRKGVDADLKQIYYKLYFAPIKNNALTHQQGADKLRAILFLK